MFSTLAAIGCGPGAVVLDIDPAPKYSSSALSFDDPVDITFSSDNAEEIYYRLDGGDIIASDLDADCMTPYDGQQAIAIKDNSWISFYGKADAASGIADTALNKKRYEISNPVYPNSVLRNGFIDAEYAIADKILCENGIVDPSDSAHCIPDLDISPKDGVVSGLEINNFVYSFHDWPTLCPDGGDARFQWLYLGPTDDGLWANIRINMYYNYCTINGLVLNGTLGNAGLASVGNLQPNLLQIFDTETEVRIGGLIDGTYRESSERLFDGLAMIEVDRLGDQYVSCSDFGCSPNDIEVRYQFNGDNYTMYDPYALYLDSCTHADDATEDEANGF